MLCHSFVFKRCLGGLREEKIYKLSLISTLEQRETILTYENKLHKNENNLEVPDFIYKYTKKIGYQIYKIYYCFKKYFY